MLEEIQKIRKLIINNNLSVKDLESLVSLTIKNKIVIDSLSEYDMLYIDKFIQQLCASIDSKKHKKEILEPYYNNSNKYLPQYYKINLLDIDFIFTTCSCDISSDFLHEKFLNLLK